MERTILIASKGMILTDGEIYGTKIFLAEGRSADDFYEISLEEYEKIIEEYEKIIEEEAMSNGSTEI